MLTTTEAAEVASVAPSTIKRWAEQGVLSFSRTPGGHRRFERSALERVLRAPSESRSGEDPVSAEWVRRLVGGRRHEIDGGLLEARARLGSWCEVADELGLALTELGKQWSSGRITIAEEHVASDAFARAICRIGDSLPTRLDGPKCLLACAPEDEHTLGLSLAELCLRELGWASLWLGRRTPVAEILRPVSSAEVSVVVLSASPRLEDARSLKALATKVAASCKQNQVGLVLGGAGAWPERPAYGVRLSSFVAFGEYLMEEGR